MDPLVEDYISNVSHWQLEIRQLRKLLLDCGLTETLKWRVPCYTFNQNNIAIIGVFKEYVTLSFFKGALLKDPFQILVQPGANSQAVRMFKFQSVEALLAREEALKNYLFEAIEIEKIGLKIDFNEKESLVFIVELQDKLEEIPAFKKAFEALTLGRQRAYHLHFSAAKQSKTRISRIEKYIPQILQGKGINDCTCGHTKKPPYCDGSHKYF